MWQQTVSDSSRTWEQALADCEGLNLAGYTDWRMPTIKELSSLVDFSRVSPAINETYFQNTLYNSNYWSSTTPAGTVSAWIGSAWVVDFASGYDDLADKDLSRNVRAVRGGQPGPVGNSSVVINLPAATLEPNIMNAFRMIGIPAIPVDDDTFNALKIFWGGVYSPGLWRLFSYTGGAYHEITAPGQDYIDYGKGWFIISADARQIEISGDILTTDFLTPVGSGYFLLACPFQDTSVTWISVVNHTSNTQLQLGANLYYWDGSGDYVLAPTLEPGKSYFAWVGAGAGGTLLIPRIVQTGSGLNNLLMLSSDGRIPSSKDRQPPPVSGDRQPPRSRTPQPPPVPGNVQPPPPLAPGAFIRITTPNGNNTWISGGQYQITWDSVGISPGGFISTVDIALSRDGGNTYQVLKNKTPNSGSCSLQTPARIRSEKCLIKITSSLYPSVSDVSDAFFSIR